MVKNTKVKVIYDDNSSNFEKKVNDFRACHIVVAMQTSTPVCNGLVVFVAFVNYLE
jgi:hypothetical protein